MSHTRLYQSLTLGQGSHELTMTHNGRSEIYCGLFHGPGRSNATSGDAMVDYYELDYTSGGPRMELQLRI
jgi:hypothetical protein